MIMHGFKKISTRIFLGIFTGTLLVISITSIVDYFFTKAYVVSLVEDLVSRSLSSAYNELSSDVRPLIMHAEAMGYAVARFKADKSEIEQMQVITMEKFPEIVGNGFARMREGQASNVNYVKRDLSVSNSNYTFNNVRSVFYDSLTKIEAKVPFYIQFRSDTISFYYHYQHESDEVFLWYDMMLHDYVKTIEQYTSQLPSRHYLFTPDKNVVLNNSTRFSLISSEEQQEDIHTIQNYLNDDFRGLAINPDLSDNRILYISKLKGTDYFLASTLQPKAIVNRIRIYMAISYLITIVALFILAIVLLRIINRLTRPITELTELSKKIEHGSLHTAIPKYEGDGETTQLSNTLRTVQSRMQRYVESLNSTLKKKRSYETDLKIANKIQFDMIPGPRRALTEYPEIDLFAEMIPAKGVAGDFYDYFFLDKETLFFVIGDVSGKGIPAALFMVKALTLIEREAVKRSNPGRIFEGVNDQLCRKNEESMFVTAICGTLNIQTGEMFLCDAGHNAPIVSFKGEGFKYEDLNKGMPLGIMPGKKYQETNYQLISGDILFFYTDGFPECVGDDASMLGENTFLDALKGKEKDELAEIAESTWNSIKDFRVNTPASDDTTLLVLRFFGAK